MTTLRDLLRDLVFATEVETQVFDGSIPEERVEDMLEETMDRIRDFFI